MKKEKRTGSAIPGVLPLAKRSGITSFSSLYSIKHALGTDKVGHTGTLDSFADGLLVVLTGSLTHLVPHITGYRKTYQAVVCFGKGTDTLDPCGKFFTLENQNPPPTEQDVKEALPLFTGALLQVPPVYSALHVDGQRASDLVRKGEEVKIEPRQIFVYRNQLLEYRSPTEDDPCSYAVLEIECSKGTYIRAIARDLAEHLGTCAHLCALRRTQVGPFTLENAALKNQLEPFTVENGIKNQQKMIELNAMILERNSQPKPKKGTAVEKEVKKDPPEVTRDIKEHFMPFTVELANVCGFEADILKDKYKKQYLNGRPLFSSMFDRLGLDQAEVDPSSDMADVKQEVANIARNEFAVFYSDHTFAGMVQKQKGHLSYSFVCPPRKNVFETFTWEQVMEGDFPFDIESVGTALTVGSFDGCHLGHEAIFSAVLDGASGRTCSNGKKLIPGAVTFSSSCKAQSSQYSGDVYTLNQKLEFLKEKGFGFAVIIDFSDDFSKIEGRDFIDILCNRCGMKFLAEGRDFRCGYKGAFSMEDIAACSQELGFRVQEVKDVSVEVSTGFEKVSSSKIRKMVQKGRFLDAQKMLSRPFELDMKGISLCQKSGEGNSAWLQVQNPMVQVLPGAGTYEAVAVLSDGSNRTGSSRIPISVDVLQEDGSASLCLTLANDEAQRLLAVSFVPVNH